MEYCEGGDLSSVIKQRKCLPEISCKRFLQQLASALQFLRYFEAQIGSESQSESLRQDIEYIEDKINKSLLFSTFLK